MANIQGLKNAITHFYGIHRSSVIVGAYTPKQGTGLLREYLGPSRGMVHAFKNDQRPYLLPDR